MAIESLNINDPRGVNDMVGHTTADTYKKILRAKYDKADLHKEIMENSPHLETAQQNF